MKKQLTLSALALCFVVGAAQFTFAQDLILDDFTTGHYSGPAVRSGTQTSTQFGGMIGGARDNGLFICNPKIKGDCASRNPYVQPSAYGFFPAKGGQPTSMVVTGGYFTGPPRFEMDYGFHTPMDVNFSAYQKIRVSFSGLTQTLNFNIQVFTDPSDHALGGCNVPALAGPFSVELPLSKFSIQGPNFDFGHIRLIQVIHQDGSAVGGMAFGVTSIVLTNTTAGGVVIACPS